MVPGAVSVSWYSWFPICMSSIAKVSVTFAPRRGTPFLLILTAKLLGAGRVIACDIDPEACVDFVGSVDAVRDHAFDVVVANINEDVIGPMLPDFERVAKHRILSGFTDESGEWTCVVF